MKINVEPNFFSSTAIETGLWHIERCLIQKYGITIAERDMYPLEWYIRTGRASGLFIRQVFTAKPFMIARKLHDGGSDLEIIERVKRYVEGFDAKNKKR